MATLADPPPPRPKPFPNPWPERRKALKQMQVTCATSPNEKLQELAEPIEKLIAKIDALGPQPGPEQLKLVLECDVLMFQVQGMGVLSYLKSLQELRNTIADKAARAPEGELKKKLQQAQAAHEEVITHLGAAYEALRLGDRPEFDKAQRKLFALQQPLKELYEKL
jgi:hypothetical protein